MKAALPPGGAAFFYGASPGIAFGAHGGFLVLYAGFLLAKLCWTNDPNRGVGLPMHYPFEGGTLA
ncbi:MAG: hypothetical protein AAF355_01370 [Myxococcota bacterium]